jgi:hypothetical protein
MIKDMSRIAVDVVLLPEQAMMDRAIEANAKLVEKFSKEIVLNKQDCLPHISLAMGCIDEGDISSIEKVLQTIAKENPLGKLRVIGILTRTHSTGERVSVFEVENTSQLQSLHEIVLEKIGPYFSKDVTSDMIYGGEEVAETTLRWIKNYREKASFAEFSPDITIGYGEAENLLFPIEFTASKLALCHLGNHCTCRKVLVSIRLERDRIDS